MDEHQRFLDACLLHAAGRLPPDEALWLARTLQSHPDWQAELDSAHNLVRLSREVLAQQEAARAPLVGFDEVMARLPAAPTAGTASPPWLEAIVRWWQQPGAMGLVMATLSAMTIGLGIQTYRIAHMGTPRHAAVEQAEDGEGYRAGQAADTVRLAVHFMPDASVAQVSALLSSRHLRVIDGPDNSQTYLIQAPAAQADVLIQTLRAESVVMSVNRVVEAP